MQARCPSCAAVYVFRFAGPCAFFGSARCACVDARDRTAFTYEGREHQACAGLRIAAGNPFGSVRDGCDLYTFKSDGARDYIVRIPGLREAARVLLRSYRPLIGVTLIFCAFFRHTEVSLWCV